MKKNWLWMIAILMLISLACGSIGKKDRTASSPTNLPQPKTTPNKPLTKMKMKMIHRQKVSKRKKMLKRRK